MNYVMSYGIGLVLSLIIYRFLPVVTVHDLCDYVGYLIFRLLVLPFCLGLTIMYLAGKL